MPATRTRPHFPRSFSVGYDADGKYALVHDLRHTQSVPASYPSTRPWGQRKRALTGPITPVPKPPLTRAHTHHHPERPSSTTAPEARSANFQGRGGGVPMRREGFGVGGPNANQRPRLQRSPPAVRRFNHSSNAFGSTMPPTAAPSLSDVLEDANSDASDEDEGDEDETNPYARYTFLPPGLSSPVPWEPETGFLRSPVVDIALPPRFPMARRTSSMLSATTIRPSLSRMGSHVHDRRLHHGPGGNADEDAFLRTAGPLLTPTARPTPPRGYSTGLTADAMRAPTLSRFNSFSARRL